MQSDTAQLNELYDTRMNLYKNLMENYVKTESSCLYAATNEQLLQEDRNLADDIQELKNRQNAVIGQINATKQRATDLYNAIAQIIDKNIELHDALDCLNIKIARLEAERTEIHKQWISKNPAKTAQDKTVDVNLHDVFNQFCRVYQVVPTTAAFKRFDNLMHGRCKSSRIFQSQPFTLDKIVSALAAKGFYDTVSALEQWFVKHT